MVADNALEEGNVHIIFSEWNLHPHFPSIRTKVGSNGTAPLFRLTALTIGAS